ncbi:glycosyltransferase family 9 protein [bacterium]|nr:glycosyltransferase family 9 protein [bacterium]
MPRFSADKICVIRTSAIGDVVNALAMVNGLRRGYPDAHISWITQQIPGKLIQNHPSINRLITFNRRMSLGKWLNFLCEIHREKYDLLLVPQVSAKASILASAIRAPIKIGYDFARARELSWMATNRRIPRHKPGHILDQFIEFLTYLGIDYPVPIWGFYFTSAELAWRDEWYSQFRKPVAVIIPASSKPEKDWDVAEYAKVIDKIVQKTGLQVAIVGGPGKREKKMAEAILSHAESSPVLALEKPVRNTLLQLSGARIVIAPDTGPLHMAVALGVPTIGLYGYSNPNRCGPYHFRELVIDKFNDSDKNPEVITRKTKSGRMATITANEVFEKVIQALNMPWEPDYPLK